MWSPAEMIVLALFNRAIRRLLGHPGANHLIFLSDGFVEVIALFVVYE